MSTQTETRENAIVAEMVHEALLADLAAKQTLPSKAVKTVKVDLPRKGDKFAIVDGAGQIVSTGTVARKPGSTLVLVEWARTGRTSMISAKGWNRVSSDTWVIEDDFDADTTI